MNKILVFALLGILFLPSFARADIAPPFLHLNVTYNGNPVNGTFYAEVLDCLNSTANYTQPTLIPQLNITRYDAAKACYWKYAGHGEGTCSNGICDFEFFNRDLKMAFYLPDLNRTFVTNEVVLQYLSAGYNTRTSGYAQLYSNGSALISSFSSPISPRPTSPSRPIGLETLFIIALVLTVVIEVIVSLLYILFKKIKDKIRIPLAVTVANVVSVTLLWFVFVYFLQFLGILIGEVFAIFFDGYVVYYFNKKRIKLSNALVMSLIMNLTSFIFGLYLLVLATGI